MTDILSSYLGGQWVAPTDEGTVLVDAATGEPITRISAQPLDYAPVLDYARTVGGPALRELTFTGRAAILKQLGKYLSERIPAFTEVSLRTGATRRDAMVDVDGGINALFVYGSKGGRQLPDSNVLPDGDFEALGKGGTFGVAHILTPRTGAAVQINAFNFPVWGMLEKFAPAFLAGVPSVVKPASATAYLTETVVRAMVESGLLPDGALQLVCARPDGLVEQLTAQDSLAVTGSYQTAATLRTHPAVVASGARFTAEADSLNSSVLGPDVSVDDPEFEVYVKGLVTEMTQKAGQKCTAIRRAFVPAAMVDAVADAAVARLQKVTVGPPADETSRMGALANQRQRADVREAVARLQKAADTVFGDPESVPANFAAGADFAAGAFLSPILLRATDPNREELHEIEAFGPVATLIPYQSAEQLAALIARGNGSLAASLVTHDDAFAAQVVLAAAPWHGRILVVNRDSAGESTGHGAAVAQAVHGGPGRAGGGEELGGLRAVEHYLQRTAVQGGPDVIAAVVGGAQ
ncbi:phenylacetic acid degradation bifunctional protein PaaZ [Gordonia hydrophobica]|uniref:Phenylacetic acid degradation bifunctional protein PaaZ n=1 Tax=Gordonia hydrophobica TaxID=40516 RepID=A0ABZ2TY09_9ACTN|nr:phenylacetic acid degradation bifunctional protein PaaZ [Gordonia hydrophobica]MBM7366951.1 oxepin-CoA hydrolase/3-oxo-5,6-dehydrosuberyl-CoA semialdehyde dehydrogenase [Gordonia hydrophobica]